ncbi:MAG: hypothetical protein ACD_58C00017G0002 [uncultured bacterium]|nr:MAG: hypothetical protein ACD_58C00017G0002 [uncultured bacterium]
MKRIHYNLIFRPEEEGGFTVMVPSLPGCISYGRNLIEAKKNIIDAIDGYIKSMIKHDELIPSDETNFITSLDYNISTTKKVSYA